MSEIEEKTPEKPKVDRARKLKTQVAYSFDPKTGAFVGTETAWESPLEPDVFHVPANATLVAPPRFHADQMAVWERGKWVVIKRPGPVLIGQ